MQHYRFYELLGQRIIRGEDVSCADDAEACTLAARRLDPANPGFDALEVWRGTVRVCRQEREAAPRKSSNARTVP